IKYKKREQCRELGVVNQHMLSSLLKESIRLVAELFNCHVENLESEIIDMANVPVLASGSLTLTSKLVYLKGNTMLTLYLNVQEDSNTATGYFWQFPVRTGLNAIYVN